MLCSLFVRVILSHCLSLELSTSFSMQPNPSHENLHETKFLNAIELQLTNHPQKTPEPIYFPHSRAFKRCFNCHKIFELNKFLSMSTVAGCAAQLKKKFKLWQTQHQKQNDRSFVYFIDFFG